MIPPPAQQHRALEASVHADDDMVILQVGTQITALTPPEARRFARYLAHAYYRANAIAFAGELRRERPEVAA